MKTCKFCGCHIGHINRDGLCAKCATVINKACYAPEKLDAETLAQFKANCEWNLRHGMYVPSRYRPRTTPPKGCCKKCGVRLTVFNTPTKGYVQHCIDCAHKIRTK